jgi:hypothetical protein
MKPLDSELNAAILKLAARHCPNGFDTSPNAPETFEGLQAHFRKTGRVVVSDAASLHTIYGRAAVNFAFRAWHDATHLAGGFPFTIEGETEACEAQCKEIASLARDKAQARAWQNIIRAEIIGQARYEAANGRFPDNQYGFVQAYLQQPSAALAASW